MHKHECPFFKRALESEETTIPLEIELVRLCLQAVIKIKVRSEFKNAFFSSVVGVSDTGERKSI